MIKYVLNRLKEKSTWVGLIALVGAAGVTISPEMAVHITEVGLAVVGLVLLVLKEKEVE